MRLIDADALQKVFEDMANDNWNKKTSTTWGRAFEESADIVDECKTIEERKKGKWIYGEDEYGIDGYHCDKCGFFVPWDYVRTFINYIEDYNFCPSCGADMRGENNG